jgi:hypothetical protein
MADTEQADKTKLQEQSNREYAAEVQSSAAGNHIWLNAFNCISPTDEFKLQLADSILRMLNNDENTIRSEFARPGYIFEDLNKRVLVLRINKS